MDLWLIFYIIILYNFKMVNKLKYLFNLRIFFFKSFKKVYLYKVFYHFIVIEYQINKVYGRFISYFKRM
jgi:hypothetical protein